MSYSIQEIIEIIDDVGLSDALKEISSESILDSALKEIWEEARVAVEKIEDYLDVNFVESDDDDEDDDIDWGSDDDDDEDGFVY